MKNVCHDLRAEIFSILFKDNSVVIFLDALKLYQRNCPTILRSEKYVGKGESAEIQSSWFNIISFYEFVVKLDGNDDFTDSTSQWDDGQGNFH